MVNNEESNVSNLSEEISFRSDHFTSFEQWASKCHLKESTLDTLRESEIDDLNTVKLLNSEDIRRLPIKLGQAKLLEWAVKKLRRCDGSMNTSKDSTFSPSSSPERKSDSFYIVPSPSKGRKSPSKVQQVNVDEDLNPDRDMDSDSSPCTIRITIETKKEDEMDAEESGYIEEVLSPTKNLIHEIEHSDECQDTPAKEAPCTSEKEETPRISVTANNGDDIIEEVEEEEQCEEKEPGQENPCEKEPCDEEPCKEESCEENLCDKLSCTEEAVKEESCEEKSGGNEPLEEEEEGDVCCEEKEEECQETTEQMEIPEGELDATRTDVDLEIKGEAILPPPPPLEIPAEINRVTLEISASSDDLKTPVTLSEDKRTMYIPIMESLPQASREDLIKHAARRIVADSLCDKGDDEYTRDKLVTFLEGAYGSTLIRLSNDHGTLKFLVPQLSEISVQTEECAEEEEEVKEEEEEAKEECAGCDVDSISGELSAPLCDLPPPAEEDEACLETLPEPPQEEECVDKPCDTRKDSDACDQEEEGTLAFHTPGEVNKFGNYMQTQIMGESLHPPATVRRPMSPVVSQPIRWECNRPTKDSSPPRIQKSPPTKTSTPVTHRTPSPQRFSSPDRASQRMRISKGLPGSPAYKATGEIDPKRKSSPPKEIVSKIKNNIESPSKGSPNKPRSPSPVKQFDASSFQLARKLAQEVADCPPDCIIIRGKDLQSCPKSLLPGCLNKSHLEDYVSNTDFRRIFKMDREDFCNLTEWHQNDLKRQVGLF